jgi:hypothetical protein
LLGNFYQQTALESAVNGLHPGRDLPGAIYIDAVDVNGTIRTGVSLFGPHYEVRGMLPVLLSASLALV